MEPKRYVLLLWCRCCAFSVCFVCVCCGYYLCVSCAMVSVFASVCLCVCAMPQSCAVRVCQAWDLGILGMCCVPNLNEISNVWLRPDLRNLVLVIVGEGHQILF